MAHNVIVLRGIEKSWMGFRLAQLSTNVLRRGAQNSHKYTKLVGGLCLSAWKCDRCTDDLSLTFCELFFYVLENIRVQVAIPR